MRKVLSWHRTGPLWRVLHYLRYGLPFQLNMRGAWATRHSLTTINLLAVEHCNNSCRFCSTSSPFAGKQTYSADAFLPWLELLTREGIEFSSIAITGGEPFLHRDLFGFISKLNEHFPHKQIGLTTNFSWASESRIKQVAPDLKSLDRMLISKYPNVVTKLGGEERFNSLVKLVREFSPHLKVAVADAEYMIAWELHPNAREPKAFCCTSDCYVLRPNGRISHCSVGVGLETRPEFLQIAAKCKEMLYDLNNGVAGLLSWSRKYPFDLCSYCTLWQGVHVAWQKT